MTTSTITTKTRLLILAFVVWLASLFMVLAAGWLRPAGARPMLNPCQYDNTCITTTVRR